MERTRSLLFEAALEGNTTTLLELLQQDRLILDRLALNDTSETPLHVASMLGHADFVKQIVSRKPELAKEVDSKRMSPLHLASANGHVETVKALLLVNQPNMCLARDDDGRNPVHLAAVKGRLEVLGELVKVAPMEAWAGSGQGETALHLCVRHNQLEALRFLVEIMMDYDFVNAQDDYGFTVLHLAVAHKQLETIKYLLTNTRIEVNAINGNGFTALDILAQSQRNIKDFDISECLRSAGALRTIDASSSTPPPRTTPPAGNSVLRFASHNPPHIKRKDTKKNVPENWLTRKREALMVVASLMATMAFQAGINPPGGVWQEDKINPPGGVWQEDKINPPGGVWQDDIRGRSILATEDPNRYKRFLYLNTGGFIASLSIIVLLITGLPFIRKFFMWILTVVMLVTVTTMALTYLQSVLFLTPHVAAELVRPVVGIGVLAWSGVMVVIFLLHTISLMCSLFRKCCA